MVTSVADPDPGSEKIRYGSRTNFDTFPDPGKNYIDPDPGKSLKFYLKNALIPCFMCLLFIPVILNYHSSIMQCCGSGMI